MQRAYQINIGNTEIMVDFGKGNDYVTEVTSTVKDNHVTVNSVRYLGSAKEWTKEDINIYLLNLLDVEDEELDEDN